MKLFSTCFLLGESAPTADVVVILSDFTAYMICFSCSYKKNNKERGEGKKKADVILVSSFLKKVCVNKGQGQLKLKMFVLFFSFCFL